MSRPLLLIGLCLLLPLGGCITINTPFSGQTNTLHATTISGQGRTRILWLPIDGLISASSSHHEFGLVSTPSVLTQVTRALAKARKDDDIGALVLRIDSPGGTVTASDEIYTRIKRYHQKTGVPVIASLGGIAASGGFYVAMSADRIVAEPTTVTGSIGVIVFDVSAAGLMHKLGIRNETVRSGKHKDGMSPMRQPTDDDRAIIQHVVDSLYSRFVHVVVANRPDLDRSQLDRITDGRVFAAIDAKRLGLVDAIGHTHDVLAMARKAAGVSHARVIRYYRGTQAPRTLTANAITSLSRGGSAASWLRSLTPAGQRLNGQPLYLWRGAAGQ